MHLCIHFRSKHAEALRFPDAHTVMFRGLLRAGERGLLGPAMLPFPPEDQSADLCLRSQDGAKIASPTFRCRCGVGRSTEPVSLTLSSLQNLLLLLAARVTDCDCPRVEHDHLYRPYSTVCNVIYAFYIEMDFGYMHTVLRRDRSARPVAKNVRSSNQSDEI